MVPAMSLTVLGLVLNLIAAGCFVPVVVYAFRRSIGTGVMVLFLPPYAPYFAFSQFEHRYKGPLLALTFGGFVLGVALRAAGVASAAAALGH